MRILIWVLPAMVLGLSGPPIMTAGDDKLPAKADKPRLPKTLARWDYPGARVYDHHDVAARLQTADDIDKVYRYYEKLASGDTVGIALPGGYAVTSLNGKMNAFLDLPRVPDDTDPKKQRERSVKVRVLAFHADPFAKTETRVVIVLSRGKDEKETDIAVVVQPTK